MTTPQFIARTKTVTRRLGWWNLQPGTILYGVEKGMGLKKGETVVRLGQIEVVSVRSEPLNAITQEDVIREGFPEWTPEQFVQMIMKHHNVKPDVTVNRIEFRHRNGQEVVTMLIFCCGCGDTVEARLTDGTEMYPHRPDLSSLPFWRCDTCRNFVGCHHKTKNRTVPLGCIPTKELKKARQYIHGILDPLWKEGGMTRREVYALIAKKLGKVGYHTAGIRSVEEARQVYRAVQTIRNKQGE